MLRDLDLRRTYHKGRGKDDLAEDFYLPAVRASCVYDRAVGYFSSSIYLLAWPSLKQFVANGGRMRLLCSPVLSDQDEMAMRQGYSDLADEALAESLKRHFAELLSSPGMTKPAVVLASLVANGMIDCRIAWISPHAEGRATRIFHDKVGLLKDASGACVVFKGSMNETWPALSLDGNIESIDVYTSWRDAGERARVVDEEAYFEEVWAGRWPGVVVKPLPESARSEIISSANIAGWEGLVDDVCLELEDAAHWSADASRQGGRLPRPHQVLALEAWTAHGRRGILEHATGSGKTFTALCAINTSFQKGEIAVVAVPSELLLEQWEDELRSTFDGMGLELLMCGGGHDAWRSNALLRAWTRPRQAGCRPRAVLTTMQTAASSHFAALCSTGEHLFLVADEVHRLGAPESQRILSLNTGPRLGLSATPQRAGDPGGTQAIMDYFDGVVPPPYTLQDAIRDGTLTPYAYHPHAIEFDKPEQDEWTRITVQIRRAHARGHQDDGSWAPGAETRFKMMLINRARLAKGAHKKIETAVRVLSESYEPGQRWIIYCDDQSQLRDVVLALRGANVPDVFEYHSAMLGDRQGTLRLFESTGGIVVSIRCLDEGVDIPSVTHALILASSKNPREFIQRRGRVLRRCPGKLLAHVHDVLVTPSLGSDSPDDFDSMLRGELLRAIEFGTHAINPAAIADLKRIAARMNIDWNEMSAGFEEDETSRDATTGVSIA